MVRWWCWLGDENGVEEVKEERDGNWKGFEDEGGEGREGGCEEDVYWD